MDKFNRPPAHYINFRIMADDGNRVDPPLDGENVVNSYVAHLKAIGDATTSDEDRALHLSWVFHQAGDVHQPLHSVARFSKALPNGDRGGNSVTFPNIDKGRNRPGNLHGYWDGLLGSDESPANVNAEADKIAAEFPREMFADELKKTNISDWAEEGVGLSVKAVYNNLDPAFTSFADAPIGYEADARKAARRRAALAGYRLGDELKRLFPPQ